MTFVLRLPSYLPMYRLVKVFVNAKFFRQGICESQFKQSINEMEEIIKVCTVISLMIKAYLDSAMLLAILISLYGPL